MNQSKADQPQSKGRVWILPNRNSIGLAALLMAMWYAGASQNNGAAYLLGFVLSAVTMVSLIHSWNNLRNIRINAGPLHPAFSGDAVAWQLHAHCHSRPSSGVRISTDGATTPAIFPEIDCDKPAAAELVFCPSGRGPFNQREIELVSLYPLGFFTARRRLTLFQSHLVFPKPEGNLPLPVSLTAARQHGSGIRLEGDDFSGVRAYQTGEPQRHIDWKAVARGQPLMIKQWTGDADETTHLDWVDTAGLQYEGRLRQLARWIILAERDHMGYSLTIPGCTIPPGRGPAHQHDCLKALALFPVEDV